MTRFLIVPQWQGSPSSRSMRLIDGAEAIAGDLPRSACTVVEVPSEAGDTLGTGVQRFTAVNRVRERVDAAIAEFDEPVMLIGGDCGTAVGAISHAANRNPGMAVVWLDAHADLHTPETSRSGAFSGMALRAVLGDADFGSLGSVGGVAGERVVLAGARDIDDAEGAILASSSITVIDAAGLADADALSAAIAATGAASVYIHIDLDVLDPAGITGVTAPVPFGAQVADVVASIARLRELLPVVGSSICGFAPASPAAAVDDMGSILRLVGALA